MTITKAKNQIFNLNFDIDLLKIQKAAEMNIGSFFCMDSSIYFFVTPGLSSNPEVKMAEKNAIHTPSIKIVFIFM